MRHAAHIALETVGEAQASQSLDVRYIANCRHIDRHHVNNHHVDNRGRLAPSLQMRVHTLRHAATVSDVTVGEAQASQSFDVRFIADRHNIDRHNIDATSITAEG